jgi:hypothetical protein
MFKIFLAIVLIIVIAMPLPAAAQPASDADTWRTFAGQLEPNAFVRVRLKNGKSFRGHVVGVSPDAIRVNPKTRVAEPLRQLSYDEIQSIDRQKEPKWNPASKVLLGVGVAVGVLYAVAIAALASVYD